MPTISRFYGIVIRMYFTDHAPPHFHAEHAEHETAFRIDTLSVREGGLPPRALRMVLERAALHRDELPENWRRAESRMPLQPIPPLG